MKDGESPLDYETLKNSNTDLIVVATDAETGRARYFNKNDDIRQDDYSIIMASSCLPIVCKPIKVYSREYFDGGISDPIPLQKALDKGCDKVVVILTKPIDADIKQLRNEAAWRLLISKHPNTAKALSNMAENYAKSLALALELQEQEKALVIATDDILGMKTLTKDVEKLQKLYEKGYSDAEKIKSFIS